MTLVLFASAEAADADAGERCGMVRRKGGEESVPVTQFAKRALLASRDGTWGNFELLNEYIVST